jgi:hypothetical protein
MQAIMTITISSMIARMRHHDRLLRGGDFVLSAGDGSVDCFSVALPISPLWFDTFFDV